MKYLIRAVKYFFYLLIILCLVIAILVMAKIIDGDISRMFIHGYDSLWQICLIMAVFAAIYPKFGFSSRVAHLYGEISVIRPRIMQVMELQGYRLEKEEGTTFSFVRRSPVSRALKMWEDRITISQTALGIEVEGLTRDLVRVVSGLEANREDA